MKFLDVGYTYASLRGDMDAAYRRVMDSGWFLNGDELAAFEQAFAAYCQAGHALGVANGLDALTLTLRAIGCGPGDEVIVPAHTFIATWLAVSATGATPVPVDACPETMNLDLARISAAVTDRTRAVIPVHLYGLPTDIERLETELGRPDIFVLEDAAQAQGAEVRGRRAGSLGDAAAFSFYPGKNLGAFGDAGAVTSNDPALIRRIRNLANYGAVEKYVHDEKGVNSRLDELQAAFLSVKLAALDGWNARRAAIAGRYLDGLKGVSRLTLPAVPAGLTPVWHLFVVRTAK
ncbi:MAG: DegT/DnrJ/EryC1/StrS family aminotransferase, partial [Caulobacteraceae bacterium]